VPLSRRVLRPSPPCYDDSAPSVLGSRALTALNHGVGFLLRATDVEYQPFRAIGFVSVGVVSALFALALPVLLF